MERVEIIFPENIHFTTELTVRITDLNYGGHLSNDRVLALAHEARVQYLNSLGFTEFDLSGVGLIMADAAIQFRSEAFAGEMINIDLAVPEVSRVGFSLFYRMTSNDREVALLRTNLVCFDYKLRKVVSLPQDVKGLWM
jgi:acyl-CoA thioester hydrolase